jgi:hypothetical protein
MRKASMAQMMGMGHSKMSKSQKQMEAKEYSKKGLPAKAMAKHEKSEYGKSKGKGCPMCGKSPCKCR